MSQGGDAQQRQGAQMQKMALMKLQDLKRPDAITYTIPKEVEEATKLYSGMYQGGLPGEDIIRDQMGAAYGESTRMNERAADSSAALLGANQNAYGRYLDAVKDLGIRSAEARLNNKQKYIDANANMALTRADYKEREWDVNVNQPYQRAMNEYWAEKQSAEAMMWGGMDRQTAGAITNQQANMQYLQMLTSLVNPLGGLGNVGGGQVAQQGQGLSAPTSLTNPVAPTINYGQVGGNIFDS